MLEILYSLKKKLKRNAMKKKFPSLKKKKKKKSYPSIYPYGKISSVQTNNEE